ncbi:MAG: response regulator [Pirellulales bacterium]
MLADAPTLLITDDDSSFRETLQALFEPRGFRTLQAGDGGEALRIVRSESIHLILLDLHMPRVGGLETLREVKSFKSILPCIVMSAGLDPETIAEVREAQAYSVLPKPVTRDEVTSSVAAAMWDAYGWRWNGLGAARTDADES